MKPYAKAKWIKRTVVALVPLFVFLLGMLPTLISRSRDSWFCTICLIIAVLGPSIWLAFVTESNALDHFILRRLGLPIPPDMIESPNLPPKTDAEKIHDLEQNVKNLQQRLHTIESIVLTMIVLGVTGAGLFFLYLHNH